MDLTNFLLLACERNMLSNKFGLDIFYRVFDEAARTAAVETGEPPDNDKPLLVKETFFLALTYIAKVIYAEREKQEKNIGAFDIMFAEILQERIETHNRKRKWSLAVVNFVQLLRAGVRRTVRRRLIFCRRTPFSAISFTMTS